MNLTHEQKVDYVYKSIEAATRGDREEALRLDQQNRWRRWLPRVSRKFSAQNTSPDGIYRKLRRNIGKIGSINDIARSGFLRRLSRLSFRLLILFILLCAGLAVYGLCDTGSATEIAVVLGTGGRSPRLAARLDRAVELYRTGQCKTIIVSGTSSGRYNEAAVMAVHLHRAGIPASAIVQDSGGYNTWETARFVSAYMKKRDISSVTVVSQYYHIARSVFALRAFGVKNAATASPRFFQRRDLRSLTREGVAFLWYAVRMTVEIT